MEIKLFSNFPLEIRQFLVGIKPTGDKRVKMSVMWPSLSLHRIAQVRVSKEKKSSKSAMWREIMIVDENGDEFEITVFGDGKAPEINIEDE